MLDKAIFYKKEHRKIFHGTKAHVRACRNHGKCVRCTEGRLFSGRKAKLAAEQEIKNFKKGE